MAALDEAKKRKADKASTARFARYRDDPVTYAAEVLNAGWWSKQIEIANSVRDRRRTTVYAGHAVGKTHGVGGLVQWHFDCFDPGITLTTAPSWESIHDLLWGELKAQRANGMPGRLMDMKLTSGPMHYAKGHNAAKGAGFQGRHEGRVFLVLDEAMGIPIYIYEAANSMMASPDCRMLLLGNPTEAAGPYYEAREDPEFNVIHISCLEHPNIAAELAGLPAPYPKAVSLTWVREMLNKHAQRTTLITADAFEFPPGSNEWYLPDDEFRSRVLGHFPKQSSSAIWSDEWLERARTTALDWRERDMPKMGVDVAREGNDLTVMYGGRGPVVEERESYAKNSITETVGRASVMADRMAERHGVERGSVVIGVDDTGLGGGVTDGLREKGYNAIGVKAGERANDPQEYFNRRAELWFEAAERGRNMQLDLTQLDDSTYRKLAAELKAARYKIQSDKTRRVEEKKEYKKRVGRSPDDADAFNLFCYDLGATPAGTTAVANAIEVKSRFVRNAPAGSRWKR